MLEGEPWVRGSVGAEAPGRPPGPRPRSARAPQRVPPPSWSEQCECAREPGGGSGGVSGKVTTTGSLNLRKGPGLAYESLFTIGKGVTLKYDKTSVDDRGVTWSRPGRPPRSCHISG